MTIGNRTRDLPACSAVTQPTAPLRGPSGEMYFLFFKGLPIIGLLDPENGGTPFIRNVGNYLLVHAT